MTMAPLGRVWCWGDMGLISSGRAFVFKEEWRVRSYGAMLCSLGVQGAQESRAWGQHSDPGIQTGRKGPWGLNIGQGATMLAVLVQESIVCRGQWGKSRGTSMHSLAC